MGLARNRDFVLVLIGQVISLMGGAVERVCIALYLLELTGSAGVFSSVLAASALPYILLAPVAGAVADAFNRRNVMIALDVASAAAMAAFGLSIFLGVRSVPVAASVVVLSAIASTLYNPAVTACIPQIVKPHQLVGANSAISLVGSWCNVLGPVLAGVLYATVGIGWIAVIHMGCFGASALLECFIRVPDVGEAMRGRDVFKVIDPRKSLKSMTSVLGTLRSGYPVVLGIIVSYGLFNVFVVPINSVMLPSVMMLDLRVSSEAYGLVEGVAASGMMVSGFLVGLRGSWFRFASSYRWAYPIPLCLIGMSAALLVGESGFWMPLVIGSMAAMVSGLMFCLGVNNIVTLTYNQTAVPTAMLGSLSALSTAFASSTAPLGQVVFGQLMEAGVPSWILFAGAAFASVAVCAFVRWNTLRAQP